MDEKRKTKKKTESSEPRERKPNWREYTATVADIEAFLGDHVYLRHNVVTGRVECRIPESDLFADWIADGLPTDQWLPISDRIVNTLWRGLSKTKEVKTVNIRQVMESDFSPDYHPFRYYLEHLPPWDGQDYLMELAMSVSVKAPIKREKSDACIGSSEREVARSEIRGEVEEQLLFAQYLKKWLVGMVAGWVDDRVVNNVILVLIGEQGSYKTTWFAHLLPPELSAYFYTKTNANRMGRDDLLTLAQYGLVCCEELDTMRPSELNQLKAAVTMQSIDERAAYAHYHEHRQHIASFCGTGNNVQFLSDATGNRRWLPFEIDSIDSPRASPFNYVGIYSQAYALYQQGFQFWFSKAEIERLGEHNRQFETPQIERELISERFRLPATGETGEFVTSTQIFQMICGNMTQKLNPNNVGRAMTALGFERLRWHGERGYLVVAYSAEEIKARQRLKAHEVTHEKSQAVDTFDAIDTIF